MRGLYVLFIALLLMAPPFVLAEPADKTPSQEVFNFTIVLQVQPARIGNETTWIGKFHVEVTLVDPKYREYLDELARNDSDSARALFWTVINNTVYASLRYNIIEKYSKAGLKPAFILPENGPITLGSGWNATVDLGVTDFLVQRGHFLVSPMSGNLTLFMANRTYAFNWNRFVLILPEGYEVHELRPKPLKRLGDVAIWENGSYVPEVSLYTPSYSFLKFLNETKDSRVLKLRYTPSDGHLYFEAVFPSSNVPGVVKKILLYSFKEELQPLSIDIVEGRNLRVVGVAIPPAKKSGGLTSVTWRVYVNLPFPFERVEVKDGSYRWIAPTVLELTVEERNTEGLILYGGVVLAVAILIVVVLQRKRNSSEGLPEGPESEEAEAPERDESSPEGVE